MDQMLNLVRGPNSFSGALQILVSLSHLLAHSLPRPGVNANKKRCSAGVTTDGKKKLRGPQQHDETLTKLPSKMGSTAARLPHATSIVRHEERHEEHSSRLDTLLVESSVAYQHDFFYFGIFLRHIT